MPKETCTITWRWSVSKKGPEKDNRTIELTDDDFGRLHVDMDDSPNNLFSKTPLMEWGQDELGPTFMSVYGNVSRQYVISVEHFGVETELFFCKNIKELRDTIAWMKPILPR